MSEIYEIIDILEQLIHEHDKMLKLAKQKKEVLIAGDIGDLNRIIQFESRVIKIIQSLELERERHVSLYSIRRGIRRDTIYLSDLIELAGPETEQGKALARRQGELGKVIKELQQLNQLNQQLIQQSLDFVNFTLEEMTAPPDEYMYKKPIASNRNGQGTENRRFFDSKA